MVHLCASVKQVFIDLRNNDMCPVQQQAFMTWISTDLFILKR